MPHDESCIPAHLYPQCKGIVAEIARLAELCPRDEFHEEVSEHRHQKRRADHARERNRIVGTRHTVHYIHDRPVQEKGEGNQWDHDAEEHGNHPLEEVEVVSLGEKTEDHRYAAEKYPQSEGEVFTDEYGNQVLLGSDVVEKRIRFLDLVEKIAVHE